VFPDRNVHKYTWTCPDAKIHNQIDHITIGRRWYSSILDERFVKGTACDIDHYLVVSEFGKHWQLMTISTEVLCGEIESHEGKSVEGYETVSD
jgi:hypothetical protein